MKQETVNEMKRMRPSEPYIPDEVRGFAEGWLEAWIMYEYPRMPKTGNIEVDEFYGTGDWDLNLYLNPESMSLDVLAAPYIEDNDSADWSYMARVVSKPYPVRRPIQNQ